MVMEEMRQRENMKRRKALEELFRKVDMKRKERKTKEDTVAAQRVNMTSSKKRRLEEDASGDTPLYKKQCPSPRNVR